jgi:erythromycin esterase
MALFIANICFGQDTDKVVTDWLKQNSITIKSIEAGSGFSDLQPLKKILKDVQVVGLGEATHGTHEFFKFKHRLMEFLVTEMGFTAFAIEASYSDCEPINDYILTGKGDRATVLTNQNYTAWDTEEFSEMLDWMRVYNQKVPDEKKLRFYGLDILSLQKVGREKVRDYFQKYVPEKLASLDSVNSIFEGQEANWLNRTNPAALQLSIIPLNSLINYLTDQKDRLVGVSSLKEWDQNQQHLVVMQQSLYSNVDSLPASIASSKLSRDEYMWQNMKYIMEREKPNTRFMVWAYNGHISTADNGLKSTADREKAFESIGYYLAQHLKEKYYALGLECYEGTCQAREILADDRFGDLKIDTLHTDLKTINWQFAQMGKPYLLVDLRQAWSNPIVSKWLDTPSSFAAAYWGHRSTKENYEIRAHKGYYDGVFFIQRSNPVHPTKNALARSKARIGF